MEHESGESDSQMAKKEDELETGVVLGLRGTLIQEKNQLIRASLKNLHTYPE